MLLEMNYYLYTPVGQIIIDGISNEFINSAIKYFLSVKKCRFSTPVIATIHIECLDEKWINVVYNGITKRVYYLSILDYLNNLLSHIICQHAKNSKMIILHGSACVYNNKTIFIIGEKGSGKTTLLLSSLRLGAKYLCDDNILLDESGVFPYETAIRVKSQGHIDGLRARSYHNISYLSLDNFDLAERQVDLPQMIIIPHKTPPDNEPIYEQIDQENGYDILTRNIKNAYDFESFVLGMKIFKKILKQSVIYRADSLSLDQLYRLYNTL